MVVSGGDGDRNVVVVVNDGKGTVVGGGGAGWREIGEYMRCFFGETERTGAGEENGGEEGGSGGGWRGERVGDEGVSEWTSGGGDWAGSEERKEGRPHGGAGGTRGGSAEEIHVLERKAAAKTRIGRACKLPMSLSLRQMECSRKRTLVARPAQVSPQMHRAQPSPDQTRRAPSSSLANQQRTFCLQSEEAQGRRLPHSNYDVPAVARVYIT